MWPSGDSRWLQPPGRSGPGASSVSLVCRAAGSHPWRHRGDLPAPAPPSSRTRPGRQGFDETAPGRGKGERGDKKVQVVTIAWTAGHTSRRVAGLAPGFVASIYRQIRLEVTGGSPVLTTIMAPLPWPGWHPVPLLAQRDGEPRGSGSRPTCYSLNRRAPAQPLCSPDRFDLLLLPGNPGHGPRPLPHPSPPLRARSVHPSALPGRASTESYILQLINPVLCVTHSIHSPLYMA